jgi:SET domain-containing protein
MLTAIGDAGPKGKGVFAKVLIQANTKVAAFEGPGKWIWEIPLEDWPYTFQVGYDRYVRPRKHGVAWYINHSCDPNCLILGRSIITWRPVASGEELTLDYSTDVDWPGFSMACSCGSPRCRKVVRAYRFLPRELKLRYGAHVAPYILRAYSASASRP